MRLKRIYNKEAPKKDWTEVGETCQTCKGKGVIINATLDGIDKCPDCTDGQVVRLVPPVAGVEIQHAGPRQNFSPNFVWGGQQEGWLSMQGVELTIAGVNRTLIYDILRVPGRYEDGTINYYECVLKEG